mgnify:CR=1 FL=1
MSAERPEVGDVWKMNGSLVHVKKIMKRPDRAVVAFERQIPGVHTGACYPSG